MKRNARKYTMDAADGTAKNKDRNGVCSSVAYVALNGISTVLPP